MRQEVVQESIKAAPPVAVTAVAVVQGFSLNEWVAIATLAYIALQAGYLLWRWWRESKGNRRKS